MQKSIFTKALVFEIILLFIGSSQTQTVLTKMNITINDSCDIPTWYIGDEWIYTADPVSFQSDNGSFNGKIENLKRKIVGITTITHGYEQFEVYEVNLTGDITGVLTWELLSGDLIGEVEGTSYIRVSDLAEVKTEIISTGIVQILFINRNYELININSFFPPLELYDFPLKLYDKWNLSSNVITSGSFLIEDLVEEEISGNDMLDVIVQCDNKEIISVPAGDFESYKITYSSDKYWYSPEVGNLVKSEVQQINRDYTLNMDLSLENFSKITQPIEITEDINPSEAFIYQEINISGLAVDSNGGPIQNGSISVEIPKVGESWITSTNENGFYNITIEAPYIIDDTPSEGEFGSDGIIVRCLSGNLDGFKVKSLLVIDDFPPDPPTIEGKINGKVGVEYEYTFTGSDEDGDDIIFYVNWGDNSPSEEVIPSDPSNTEAKAKHKWEKSGTYNITAITVDVFGAESKSSDPFLVTMPRSKSNINSLLKRFIQQYQNLFTLIKYLFYIY